MSWLFASGGQSIGASASVSVLSMSIQVDYLLKFTSLAIGGIGFETVSPDNYVPETERKHMMVWWW